MGHIPNGLTTSHTYSHKPNHYPFGFTNAPEFEEIGLGTQPELPTSVSRLLKHGFLEDLTP